MRKTEKKLFWCQPERRNWIMCFALNPHYLPEVKNKVDLTEEFINELYDNVIELRKAVEPSTEEIQQCLYQLQELRALPMPNQYCRDTIELIEQHLERLQ